AVEAPFHGDMLQASHVYMATSNGFISHAWSEADGDSGRRWSDLHASNGIKIWLELYVLQMVELQVLNADVELPSGV
ncbi:hypothetical protein Dimus_018328, partial [Dionaea muscipula]